MSQNQVDKVKSGYSELQASERAAVKRFIEEFDIATESKREEFSRTLKGVTNKSLGPIATSACPCCGKT